MSSEDQKKQSAEINRMILSSLRPRIGRATAKMMVDLKAETGAPDTAFAVESKCDYSREPINTSGKTADLMVGWLDEMFDWFQRYQFEFNKTTERDDLIVAVQRPEIVQEIVLLDPRSSAEVQFFKGTVATRDFALILRGQDSLIEGFLLPLQAVHTLSARSSVPRFVLLRPYKADGQSFWRMENELLEWEDLRALARQLFSSLVKLAKGELSIATRTDDAAPTKLPTNPRLSAADALRQLQQQTQSDEQKLDVTVPNISETIKSDRSTNETLQALLERNRKRYEIQKMTRRTKARFKHNFGATLENPDEPNT